MKNLLNDLTFKNGALYQGYVSPSHMLANVKDGKIYKGSSTRDLRTKTWTTLGS